MATRFQLDTPESTRRAVKVEAARAGVLVSQLATVCLDYVTGLMAAGRTPPEVEAALDRIRSGESAEAEKTEEEEKPRRRRKPPTDSN